ncbi:MAG: class I SAM-dependent methyltransferase [Nitrospirota bacterium]|nr:class I SAM-dependent methyltransferase [Nitrospirota bacterium]
MTEFAGSNWARPEFAKQYRDNADIYIVERQRMLGIMRSFYRHFLSGRKNNVLDLGCGDGIITHNLLEVDNAISATLVDASSDMLDKARERLRGFRSIDFMQASFQDIMVKDLPERGYDLVVSSMAIHHLTQDEKKKLFNIIHTWLKPGGLFLNIDVVIAPAGALEDWYMKIWEEWMDNKRKELGAFDESSSEVIKRYKAAGENRPDTLDDQLNALRKIGFRDVDCYYKYGIFTVFGGKKQDARN